MVAFSATSTSRSASGAIDLDQERAAVDRIMSKLFHCVEGEWIEHSQPPILELRGAEDGPPRLAATAPGGDPTILRSLVGCLTPPFMLLYAGVDFEHEHHYRAAFDGDAKALLEAFDWYRTPLRPEDEQWPKKEEGGS
jgi:hypothetical protein